MGNYHTITTTSALYDYMQGVISEYINNVWGNIWHVIEWVSDCCLNPTQQCFNYIMARISKWSRRWWWCPLCTRLTHLCGCFIALAHWNNSPQIDILPHSDILSWFRANHSLLFLLNNACLSERQQIHIS